VPSGSDTVHYLSAPLEKAKIYKGQSNDFYIDCEVSSGSDSIYHSSPPLETTSLYAYQFKDFHIYQEVLSGPNLIHHLFFFEKKIGGQAP
jgi:hypothetical protein